MKLQTSFCRETNGVWVFLSIFAFIAVMCDVLLVGSNGYLAQFLGQEFRRRHINVCYASHTQNPKDDSHCLLDFGNSASIRQALRKASPKAVVNAAAMSSPRACQESPTESQAINCPRNLVDECLALEQVPFLIHFSTDQVFDGSKPPYTEADAAAPLNTYATHKADFDALIQSKYPSGKYCIIRPTNIIGPAAPGGGPTKFLQWLFESLKKLNDGASVEPLRLFDDEFRNYVCVHDVVDCTLEVLRRAGIVDHPAAGAEAGAAAPAASASAEHASKPNFLKEFPLESVPHVLHASGPRALTRVQVGRAVLAKVHALAQQQGAQILKEDALIKATPRASVDIGYPSPLNLSMPPMCFRRLMQREPRSLAECIDDAFAAQTT